MKDENILGMYLKEINRVPLLSHEEETELAMKAKEGDKMAKEKIVNANLRFVVNIAKKYQNHGIELVDLISEGNIGLLTAIDKFEVEKGYHFISYAVWWIRQAILKAISEKSHAIRLPLNRANELVQIEHARKTLSGLNSETEEIEEIAEMLHMEPMHVREMLNISREMVSLDAPVASANHTENSNVGDFVEDKRFGTPDAAVMDNALSEDLNKVIDTLKPSEAKVIRLRYGLTGMKPMSLKEVGDECDLTKERIRQIEKHAISRMQHPRRMRQLEDYLVA